MKNEIIENHLNIFVIYGFSHFSAACIYSFPIHVNTPHLWEKCWTSETELNDNDGGDGNLHKRHRRRRLRHNHNDNHKAKKNTATTTAARHGTAAAQSDNEIARGGNVRSFVCWFVVCVEWKKKNHHIQHTQSTARTNDCREKKSNIQREPKTEQRKKAKTQNETDEHDDEERNDENEFFFFLENCTRRIFFKFQLQFLYEICIAIDNFFTQIYLLIIN